MSSTAARSKLKSESGDKTFVGGSAKDKKVIIRDIIACIQQKAPKTLLITLSDLSTFLQHQPPTSPSNLFRKQYGNLEHVFSYEDFKPFFQPVENSVVRLQTLEHLNKSYEQGLMDESLYQQCVEMHTNKRRHDLNTLKMVDKNECATCGKTYAVLANKEGLCTDGGSHTPAFDWSKDHDPLNCAM